MRALKTRQWMGRMKRKIKQRGMTVIAPKVVWRGKDRILILHRWSLRNREQRIVKEVNISYTIKPI